MSAGNLPATQENVEELAGAVDKVSQISDLSGEAKKLSGEKIGLHRQLIMYTRQSICSHRAVRDSRTQR